MIEHSISSFSTENLRAWHYMWSMFYFYKKNYNFIFALEKTILFHVKDLIVLIYSILIFDKENFKKRFFRVFGFFVH